MSSLIPCWWFAIAALIAGAVVWLLLTLLLAAWAGTRSAREKELATWGDRIEDALEDALLDNERLEAQVLPWAKRVRPEHAQDMARLDRCVADILDHRAACARAWADEVSS